MPPHQSTPDVHMIEFQARIPRKLTFFPLKMSFVTDISLGYAAMWNDSIFNIFSHMIKKKEIKRQSSIFDRLTLINFCLFLHFEITEIKRETYNFNI